MAVTFTPSRLHATSDQSTFIEFCTATVTGTYLTGGFTFNPYTIVAGKGSAPLPSSNMLTIDWYSPLGYNYRSTVSGNTVTTKIYSVSGTELANTTAVPDATINFTMIKRKL